MPTRRTFLTLSAGAALMPAAVNAGLSARPPAAAIRLLVEADTWEATRFAAAAAQGRGMTCSNAASSIPELDLIAGRDAPGLIGGFTHDAVNVIAEQLLAGHGYTPVWRSTHVTQAAAVRHVLAGSRVQAAACTRHLRRAASPWPATLAHATGILGGSQGIDSSTALELPAPGTAEPSHYVFWLLRREAK